MTAGGSEPAILAPQEGDSRVVRLGRLAAAALIERGEPVSRSSLAAESKLVDLVPSGKRRGFSESAIDANDALREIYEAVRGFVPRRQPRRTGHVSAQIMRLDVWTVAQRLLLARAAASEWENRLRRARARSPEHFHFAELNAVVRIRNDHRANQPPGEISPKTLAARKAIAASNRAKVLKALGSPERCAGILPPERRRRAHPGRRRQAAADAGLARLTEETGLGESTVLRIMRELAERARAARLGKEPVLPPAMLLRLPKKVLARALEIERLYIRTLAASVRDIARHMAPLELEAARKSARDAGLIRNGA